MGSEERKRCKVEAGCVALETGGACEREYDGCNRAPPSSNRSPVLSRDERLTQFEPLDGLVAPRAQDGSYSTLKPVYLSGEPSTTAPLPQHVAMLASLAPVVQETILPNGTKQARPTQLPWPTQLT